MATLSQCGSFAMVVSMYLLFVHGNTYIVKFRGGNTYKLPENLVDKTIAADGLTLCVVLCKSETDFQCKTVSWGNGTCLLSKEVMINGFHNLDQDETWTTICRVHYPVFHARGDLGRYTLSYVDAEAKCQELGSIVASRQDILEAWAMGYEYCACGWLSDQTTGFVMQTDEPGCGGSSNGTINGGCTALADVYCTTS